ncbi:hypothetical protein SCA03_57600 [Streptomyces cacaoi]|uniref:Uncharacterized protein n=1 Tax=Streptomyces cacaoi TaxID=1898 RepID=A0A4Y3R763_STRCI|nr:hypothetical protein SCA03_57600 [Streptomyces cacaoi]
MAHRDVTAERAEGRLVENLRDEAHVLEDEDLGSVAHCDTRGLLTAVLQGVQTEIRELGDLFARSPDTEDAAGVLGAFLTGEKVVVESSVTTWHAIESRTGASLLRTGEL